MCGIVGLISKKAGGFFHNDLTMFQAMLVNDSQRGEDSTGAFMVDRDGGAELIKVASNPFNLFACDAWSKFRSAAIQRGKILVGHNRKATQGAVNSDNAHPFQEGPIVLVHNGTLRNHLSWNTKKEVDSHALCQLIAEKGHEEAIKQVDGAFALVWYNLETHKLYMIRNKERPLSLVITDDMIAFASEGWMAWGQFHRDSVKVTENLLLDEGVLYEFDLAKAGEYTTKKLELYTPPPVKMTHYQGRRHPYYNSGYEEDTVWDNDFGWIPYRKPTQDDLLQRAQNVVTPFARPDFKNGDIVQLRIERIKTEINYSVNNTSMPKFWGKVTEFGKPEVDCVGWLAADTKPAEFEDYMTYPCVGEVLSIVNGNAGPSVWLKDVEMDDEVTCYNGVVFGGHTWDKKIAGTPCTKCKKEIEVLDFAFTSVNLKKEAEPRIHCHECVHDSLPEGEIKNAFVSRRSAAVQARLEQRKRTQQSPQPAILLPGPTTPQ